MSMYQEKLLQYYRAKPHWGVIEHPTLRTGLHNPSCGDQVHLTINIEGGIIKDMRFTGAGCVISIASTAMLCEQLIGQAWNKVGELDAQYMQALIGMQLGPNRLRCCMLALEALKMLQEQHA